MVMLSFTNAQITLLASHCVNETEKRYSVDLNQDVNYFAVRLFPSEFALHRFNYLNFSLSV